MCLEMLNRMIPYTNAWFPHSLMWKHMPHDQIITPSILHAKILIIREISSKTGKKGYTWLKYKHPKSFLAIFYKMNYWEKIEQLHVLEQIKANRSTVITGTNVINCLFSYMVFVTSKPQPQNGAEPFCQWQQAEICEACRSKFYSCCYCEIPYSHGEEWRPWSSCRFVTVQSLVNSNLRITSAHPFSSYFPQKKQCLETKYHTCTWWYYLTFSCCKHLQQMDELHLMEE